MTNNRKEIDRYHMVVCVSNTGRNVWGETGIYQGKESLDIS